MNKKFLLIVALLLIVPTLLAACGGGLSEDDAEKGIKAAFEGNRSEAEKYICAEETGDISGGAMPEGTSTDVSCKKDGDKMNCDVKFSGSEVPEGLDTVAITFDIKDDKLCNPEIAMPEFEVPDLDVPMPTEEPAN